MNVFTQPPRVELAPAPHLPDCIEIVEPNPEDCPKVVLPPEGNIKLRNYRLLNENLRAYTPTGDIHTSPSKAKLVPRFDVCSTISPPRMKILELLKPEDPGRDALEAIVRPAPRRGLTRPLDDDTRRFLQRALLSPSPHMLSTPTPNPKPTPEKKQPETNMDKPPSPKIDWSLADELKEAEESSIGQDVVGEFRSRSAGWGSEAERERMGRLALSMEEDEGEDRLCGAARRLDALLAESRGLHAELAGIQQDLQTQSARARRCSAAARALSQESLSLRFLDDVVALLKGDVTAALRTRAWPFALGRRQPDKNYIV